MPNLATRPVFADRYGKPAYRKFAGGRVTRSSDHIEGRHLTPVRVHYERQAKEAEPGRWQYVVFWMVAIPAVVIVIAGGF